MVDNYEKARQQKRKWSRKASTMARSFWELEIVFNRYEQRTWSDESEKQKVLQLIKDMQYNLREVENGYDWMVSHLTGE